MATSRRQASTTSSGNGNREATEITPAYCCIAFFGSTLYSVVLCLIVLGTKLGGDSRCYFELYANSVSVSNSTTNANVSTADWSFGFVAKSPLTGCKISLYSIKSRLLRGQEVISESSSPSVGFFGFAASYKPDWTVTNLDFDKVVTPEVIGDVVWNVRVEVVARMNTDVKYGNGDLIMHSFLDYADERFVVNCRDLPVEFTADSAGNKMGSLLGNMRRCDYKIVDNLDTSDSWN